MLFSLIQSTTAVTKNSVLFVDQLSKPSFCNGLAKSLWVHGSACILPIPHCLCFPTLLLGSVEILSQSSAHRIVYLTLRFSYQLHHPAVAARPKLFSIVPELNGARPSESTGLEAL